ncbi:MAG TPA: hypothetical protein VNK82_08250 [Terriglobales bacterium]|nr:hypothetical protein [Terriglobales bacterium]
MKEVKHMPRGVAHRIMERAAAIGRGRLVLVIRDGKPSRVYGEAEYEKRKALTKEVKPWERRKRKVAADPLGAIDGTVLGPIRREDIYE